MKLNSISRVLLMMFVLALSGLWQSQAAASEYMCRLIHEGKVPFEREVQTVRVLNQGKNGNCWLFAYAGMAEAEIARMAGRKIPISLSHLVKQDLRQEAWDYLNQKQNDINIGDFPSKGHYLAKEYGLIPESVWKSPKEPKDWPLEDWANQVEHLADKNRHLGRDEAWKVIDRFIDEQIGVEPRAFEFEGVTYTPKDFAKKFLDVEGSNGRDFFVNLTRKNEGRSSYCKNGICYTQMEGEQQATKLLDGGKTIIFSYDFPRAMHDSQLGLIRDMGLAPISKFDGRHAVLVTGYIKDLDGRVIAWKIQNSWGADRGVQGIYLMSRQFFERYVYSISLYGQHPSN